MIKIINDLSGFKLRDDFWSFPLEELDYLLETHEGETFLLLGTRLFEVEEE